MLMIYHNLQQAHNQNCQHILDDAPGDWSSFLKVAKNHIAQGKDDADDGNFEPK